MECWPRYAAPRSSAADSQYKGWPKTITQVQNYAREPVAFLPTIRVTGITNPVIQVVAEAGNEVLYTLRILGREFTPWVFGSGTHTVRVADQGIESAEEIGGLVGTAASDSAKIIDIAF